jgi:glucose 1-dehydrogenase
LKGQKALVTGASSGIGEGVALALGAAGAAVAVNYSKNAEAAGRIVETIRTSGADAMAIRGDISREDEVQAMFRQMLTSWGTIDILVNNSGLQQDAHFTDMTIEQWNTVLGVNLTGMFLCAREAAREMIWRGIRPDVSRAAGKIICIPRCTRSSPGRGT